MGHEDTETGSLIYKKPIAQTVEFTTKDIQQAAVKQTIAQASKIIPPELKPFSMRYSPIILNQVSVGKGKQEFEADLIKARTNPADTKLILQLYDIISEGYKKNFASVAGSMSVGQYGLAEDAKKRGDNENAEIYAKNAERYMQVFQNNKGILGLDERDFYNGAKDSEYGKDMTADNWRGFITTAVHNGFDRVTALDTLSGWGIVPPTLLQAPQKITEFLQKIMAMLTELTLEELKRILKDIEKDKLEKVESLLQNEYKEKTELGKSTKEEATEATKGSKEQEKRIGKVIKEMAKIIAVVAKETKSKPEEIIKAFNGKTKDVEEMRQKILANATQRMT